MEGGASDRPPSHGNLARHLDIRRRSLRAPPSLDEQPTSGVADQWLAAFRFAARTSPFAAVSAQIQRKLPRWLRHDWGLYRSGLTFPVGDACVPMGNGSRTAAAATRIIALPRPLTTPVAGGAARRTARRWMNARSRCAAAATASRCAYRCNARRRFSRCLRRSQARASSGRCRDCESGSALRRPRSARSAHSLRCRRE